MVVVVDTDAAVALDRDLVTVEGEEEAVDAHDLVLDHHEGKRYSSRSNKVYVMQILSKFRSQY